MNQADHSKPESAFQKALNDVRKRWKLRRVCEGAAISVAIVVVAVLVSVLLMNGRLFDPGAVAVAKIAVYSGGIIAIFLLIIYPWLKRINDIRIAHYIESHNPDMDALVQSAAHMLKQAEHEVRNTSPVLTRRLLLRAAAEVSENKAVRGHDSKRTRRATIAIATTVVAAVALVALGPDYFRHGLGLLFPKSATTASEPFYTIEVKPGDLEIPQGEDQLVLAHMQGFSPVSVQLWTRKTDVIEWQEQDMSSLETGGEFESRLFNIQSSQEYYVQSGSVRSDVHKLNVVPWPSVSRVDVYYHYPARTGRESELIENRADISAIKGTRVEITVTPSIPVENGMLVLDNGQSINLVRDGDVLTAKLEIDQDGQYRIDLPVSIDKLVVASPEYAIEALEDGLPTATIASPGRDLSVTSVEEAQIELRASDDIAVQNLELVISINGEDEQVVQLANTASAQADVSEVHTLYLEEKGLAPGDLISYYARVGDSSEDPGREFVTDMFFMEVRPFEKEFSESGGGGGGGGGQQGGGEQKLAAQQKALVVALFKLLRDRIDLADEVVSERTATMAEAQRRIHDRVRAIERRISGRNMVDENQGYRVMAEALPKAMEAMDEVESALDGQNSDDAMRPARTALLHLQRADAAFRRVQIARQRSGGGGGGGGDQDDLANLFRLEMDRFRNQYENVQREQPESPAQERDEALDKLRELAHRQQREVERAGLRDSNGQGSADSQQALAEAVEELIRELERLTRERPNEELQESLDKLRNAAKSMQDEGGKGAAQASREALDQLREAQKTLDSDVAKRSEQALEGARQKAESLAERQSEVRNEIDRAAASGGLSSEELDRLRQEKDDMIADAAGLEQELRKLAKESNDPEQETAKALDKTIKTLEEEDLVERMRYSNRNLWGVVDEENQATEAQIERTIKRMREELAGTEQGGESRSADADQMKQALRDLTREMDANGRRAESSTGGQASAGDQSVEGQSGTARVGSAGGANGGAINGGFGGGRDGVFDARDISRIDIQQAARSGSEALNEYAGRFPVGRTQEGSLELVVAGLEALVESDLSTDKLAEQYSRLIDQLKSIEYRMGDDEQEAPRVRAARTVKAPAGYEALVDEYYQRLSENAEK